MAPYTIAQCTIADSAALSRNNISAFWEDPHWLLEWRHRTLEYHIAQVAKRTPRNLLNNRLAHRHQKAIDPETGRLLGYARWYLPPSHAINTDGTPAWPEAIVPAVGPEEETEIRRMADDTIWDPNCDADELLVPIREMKDEILARKTYMRLDYMAVHPQNQGKGVATALVQSGMKQAEKMGLDIFIHAMKAGVGVYKRLGFHIEKELIQDDSMFGGNGEYYTSNPDNILVNYGTGSYRFADVQLAGFGDVTRIDPKHFLKVGMDGPHMGAAIFRNPEAMMQLRWGPPTDIGHLARRLIWGLDWHMFKPDPKDATTDDEEYLSHIIIRQLAHFGPVPKSYIALIPRDDGDRWSILASATQYIEDNQKQRPFKILENDGLTEEDRESLLQIMKSNPRDRPTASQLLQDKWLINVL
ncbi:MAG: hypothetical protein M1818_006762 [Claussenomyces sp. TS43310]|nr:MAG: hypothetical protein M1818_006762 [Claussenomyces sp. TS43310]